jgi:hypothetical protein
LSENAFYRLDNTVDENAISLSAASQRKIRRKPIIDTNYCLISLQSLVFFVLAEAQQIVGDRMYLLDT